MLACATCDWRQARKSRPSEAFYSAKCAPPPALAVHCFNLLRATLLGRAAGGIGQGANDPVLLWPQAVPPTRDHVRRSPQRVPLPSPPSQLSSILLSACLSAPLHCVHVPHARVDAAPTLAGDRSTEDAGPPQRASHHGVFHERQPRQGVHYHRCGCPAFPSALFPIGAPASLKHVTGECDPLLSLAAEGSGHPSTAVTVDCHARLCGA